MKNVKFVVIGFICLLAALIVFSGISSAEIPEGGIPLDVNKTVPADVQAARDLSEELNVSYDEARAILSYPQDSGVQVITSYMNNPIHPALSRYGNDWIIYNDMDFFLYSSEPTNYKISIYINQDEPDAVLEGDMSFSMLENYQVPEGVKRLRKVVVLIGEEKYEWENVKVMHKAIDEDQVYTSPEDEVTKKELWISSLKAFFGGVIAACCFGWLFWKWWKKHLENQVQEVL